MKKNVLSIILILTFALSAFSVNAYAAEMEDGTYEVNIALWHSEDDKESMAADAVGTKATIAVENGVKIMHITSGEMSMMGIKASLQELRTADANGNFTDAKVESRNAEGNPTGFYFVMPHTEEYITVKVNPHLAIMGNRDIGARIRVDYSTLKMIKAAEPATAAEPGTTVIQSVGKNGEAVTEIAAVEPTNSKGTAEAIKTTQSMQAEGITDEAPPKESSKTALCITIAVVAAVIVLMAVKKKVKK